MSETQVLHAEAFKRFRQTVRMKIRQHVRREHAAPPLTLWASTEANPRKVVPVAIGAAHNEAGVRENAVNAIRQHGSSFAALGRLLYHADDGDGRGAATSMYGLVVVCTERVEGWDAAIVNGRVDSWSPAKIGDGRESPEHAWYWLQQAIRGAR